MKTSTQKLIPALALSLFFAAPSAWALDQIIRPYQSVRSAGMGGVRMITGLFDENFFGNPARVTANPHSRFTLLNVTPLEITPATLSAGSSVAAGTSPLTVAANSAGQNLHDRMQIIFPAYYHAAIEDRKMAFAIGMIASFQMDANLRQSYQTNFGGVADIGPAVTLGRKFLADDKLSVGLTAHFIYRVAASPTYGLIDYIRGVPLTLTNLGGDGAMIDFDLGGTYEITKWGDFNINAGVAMQNVLGGSYSNLGISFLNLSSRPPAQPRSIGVGGSLSRATWGAFTNTVAALEFTDILNNGNGSIFRTIHIGGETHWKSFAVRLGLNQGYWTAGLGVDFRFITLDLASYGEEMGLNAGTLEDRRYTLNLGLHI
jgi:hypothetical protein